MRDIVYLEFSLKIKKKKKEIKSHIPRKIHN